MTFAFLFYCLLRLCFWKIRKKYIVQYCGIWLFLGASITIFAMQYSLLSAVTSFKESFWRAERRKGRRTRRKLFHEKLLNYFFAISSTAWKARRGGVLYSIRLCLTMPVNERGSSFLSLTSFSSTGECVGEFVSQRKLWSAVHRSDNDIVAVMESAT